MTRFISVFLAVSFFISPFSVFAEEVPTTTPLEVPVFLFSDKHDGILGIVPISENSFVFAYATTSEFAEIGFINLARPVEGSAASTNTENPSFTPLGILLVPLNLEFESVSQSLESGAGVGQRIFTSHEYDSHAPTNYSYAEARYLDTVRGRFMSQEPLVWESPEGFLEDPQLFNSYAYARNNPIKFVDPDGKLVELAARPVFTTFTPHLFFIVTPDNPGEINISGLPTGTTQFTFGGYNRDGGVTLTPEIGYEGQSNPNNDVAYITGEKSVIDKIAITPPNRQSDTEFINSMGAAFNEIDPVSYFWFGQRGKFGYTNSNNFVNELGSKVGIEDQVGSFNPKGFNFAFGSKKGLPKTTMTQYIQQQINVLKEQMDALKEISKTNLMIYKSRDFPF